MGEFYARYHDGAIMEWPLLKQLQNQGIIAALDIYFAERAASHSGTIAEEEAAVLAAVMAAARRGHLCLDRKGAAEIFAEENPLKDPFFKLLERGFSSLEDNGDKLKPFIHRIEDRFYLPKNYALEEALRFHLGRLAGQCLDRTISDFPLRANLNEEQRQAVAIALQHRLTLMTGGPGTGKTYTAAAIVQAFTVHTPSAKIVLAAPTARAADHLKKRLLESAIDPSYLRYAGTLHGLLGNRNVHTPPEVPCIDAQLIIIDECSMIDAGLFVALLASLPKQSTIILMGDPDQLHPVGIGSLFSDLVLAELPLPLGRAHLQHCLRVEDRPLLELTAALQSGLPCEWPLLDWSVDAQQAQDFYAKLWEFARPFWIGFALGPTPEVRDHEALKHLGRFRILSVLRQGPFGTDVLNEWLARRLQLEVKQGQWWAAPIQITRNDAKAGLCNGELGVLIQPRAASLSFRHPEGYALFPGMENPLPAALLPAFAYAFCTSVHKSQGSEYEEVLLIVPPGSEVFGREMLYTAITRAKKKLHIASTEEILSKVRKHHIRKLSGIT